MKALGNAAGEITVAGKTLETLCVGPQQASAYVLLHEGLGCIQLWRDFPEALADSTGLSVFAYSRAGYGNSDPVQLPRPLDYMTREAVEVLPEVLNSMGAQEVVLVGHSDGATIAAIHAGRIADEKVRGVVLIAPHFFTEPAGLAEIANARDAFNNGDLRTRLAKYHRDPDNAFHGWNDAWLDPQFKTWNVTDALNDIRVPVLCIQGREDPYGTLAQIEAVTARTKHAPVTTHILNDCRHAPHFEHGPSVIKAITEFSNQL